MGLEGMSHTRTHAFPNHANRSHSERNYLRRVFAKWAVVLSVAIAVWFWMGEWSPLLWLLLGGWALITYFGIGWISVTVLVLVVGIYVSPIPMWVKWDVDCGSIPAWKCRWTCKDFQELKDLGADYYGNDPDFARVEEAGGLCQP